MQDAPIEYEYEEFAERLETMSPKARTLVHKMIGALNNMDSQLEQKTFMLAAAKRAHARHIKKLQTDPITQKDIDYLQEGKKAIDKITFDIKQLSRQT